ncbi:hypothetical protein [Streptomyces daliensis]
MAGPGLITDPEDRTRLDRALDHVVARLLDESATDREGVMDREPSGATRVTRG